MQDPELEGGLAAISACDGLVSAPGELAGQEEKETTEDEMAGWHH